MNSHRARAIFALMAALFVGALLAFVLIDLGALRSAPSDLSRRLADAYLYGLPIGAVAVVATEALFLRRLSAHIAIGTVLTFVVAHLLTWGEPLNSPTFSGGILLALGLVAVGLGASITYWGIAGRRAGWRGDQQELAEQRVAAAFENVSEDAEAEPCRVCLLAWFAAAVGLAPLLVFGLIEASGLRSGLLAEAERQGQAILQQAGYDWATFSIAEDRGVIAGNAPDELQKRDAYDRMREALNPITGFPGLISGIDDRATARVPVASVSRKLAEVARREEEARRAIEDARRSAEETKAAAEDMKRREAESAAAVAARTPATEDEATSEPVSEDVAARPPRPVEAPATPAASPSSASGDAGSEETEPPPESPPCSSDHRAIVKSSVILFERQRFGVAATYEGELERLAATAQACAPWPLVIVGHADSYDDNVFNERISSLRAITVRDDLIARGVSPELVVAKAASDTPPAAKENEETAFNRRAEFRLVEPSKITRDATQDPAARAQNCESDLAAIMSKSIIHFAIGSARVTEPGIVVIRELATAIGKCGSVIVSVEGHTDSIGTPDKNQTLSESRAGSVRDLLVTAGVDPTRIITRGFASSQPYDTAETQEAYALNRRIEFKVTSKFTTTGAGGP